MTTPADPWLVTIPSIRDRASLELVVRLIDSQLTVLEAQVVQLREVSKLAKERVKQLGVKG